MIPIRVCGAGGRVPKGTMLASEILKAASTFSPSYKERISVGLWFASALVNIMEISCF